ncbi:hypothetical protein EVAR_98991_1 [Eumeta japonica]|uniref:Uncharacterized protein n=1 Tax=Eumeta variegata TaxID=151549 RepID=A0A4C1YN13_EUMVA|nr:hypothetical protein EVAR_98991_1 [Eumeta japonica]
MSRGSFLNVTSDPRLSHSGSHIKPSARSVFVLCSDTVAASADDSADFLLIPALRRSRTSAMTTRQKSKSSRTHGARCRDRHLATEIAALVDRERRHVLAETCPGCLP